MSILSADGASLQVSLWLHTGMLQVLYCKQFPGVHIFTIEVRPREGMHLI